MSHFGVDGLQDRILTVLAGRSNGRLNVGQNANLYRQLLNLMDLTYDHQRVDEIRAALESLHRCGKVEIEYKDGGPERKRAAKGVRLVDSRDDHIAEVSQSDNLENESRELLIEIIQDLRQKLIHTQLRLAAAERSIDGLDDLIAECEASSRRAEKLSSDNERLRQELELVSPKLESAKREACDLKRQLNEALAAKRRADSSAERSERKARRALSRCDDLIERRNQARAVAESIVSDAICSLGEKTAMDDLLDVGLESETHHKGAAFGVPPSSASRLLRIVNLMTP